MQLTRKSYKGNTTKFDKIMTLPNLMCIC